MPGPEQGDPIPAVALYLMWGLCRLDWVLLLHLRLAKPNKLLSRLGRHRILCSLRCWHVLCLCLCLCLCLSGGTVASTVVKAMVVDGHLSAITVWGWSAIPTH